MIRALCLSGSAALCVVEHVDAIGGRPFIYTADACRFVCPDATAALVFQPECCALFWSQISRTAVSTHACAQPMKPKARQIR